MFYQHITAAEIEYRQESVRTDFIESQRIVSIRGVREMIGNTFMQLGASIHGKAREACRDAAETCDLICETRREWQDSTGQRSISLG
jgi:hypothetical protein